MVLIALYLHSWSCGDGFSMLAKLEGHKKAVSGIVLPLGSDKLYSASSDGTLRIWDCHSGKCARLSNIGDDVGSIISEGQWVFIGMKNIVKLQLNRVIWIIFSEVNPFQLVGSMKVHPGAVLCLTVGRTSHILVLSITL
ncbi:hypothetical protein COLO4_15557 [Corchorus olitorius]|uniref:Uncharacterized protein n=1 Tax=Corchorus olitorius TaxID=93759 RepID=A0A1R3JMG8_9ROSI|nr:hypothetical protein COLO4_15557 [Corchorus olitorius]